MSSRKVLGLFLFTFSCNYMLFSFHNAGRYFPFLEKPYSQKDSYSVTITPAVYFTSVPGRYKMDGETGRIGELYGTYNLRDIINSSQQVTEKINGQVFLHPFRAGGPEPRPDYIDKDIFFKVNGALRAHGVTLQYKQRLLDNLSIGAWMPFMHVESSHEFYYSPEERHRINTTGVFKQSDIGMSLSDAELSQLDRVRRSLHTSLGLEAPDYVKNGIGDLDLWVRWHRDWHYKWLMREINLNFRFGCIVPTGNQRVQNNPASVPFMHDGRAGFYFEALPEFEIKPEWHVGMIIAFLHQFNSKQLTRLPVDAEPFMYSALKGRVHIDPGFSLKLSPYVTLTHIVDGLHIQLRYTYIRHNMDVIKDWRSSQETVLLQSKLGPVQDHSRWSSCFVSARLEYDTTERFERWALKPQFFLAYDFDVRAFGGRNAAQHEQVSLGADLRF
jgi:hypothetical protein